MRLIDGDELYKAMKDAEDLARQRVLDTESTLPYPNNLNPSYTRYLAQMDERTKAKHMIADAQTVYAVPVVRCYDCKWMQCNMKPDGTLPKGVDEYECRHWCGACDPTDFCSRGERNDGEQHEP